MSLLKKILSPIMGIVPSSLGHRHGGNKKESLITPKKQSTTRYSCMFELHEYNKKKDYRAK